MKYVKLLVIFFIIVVVDIATHYLIETKWAGHLSWPINGLSFFVLLMLMTNGISGWYYLKSSAAKWLTYSWLGIYVFNSIYFLIRWGLFATGFMPNSFLYNGSANIGLSVFTFCTFCLLKYSEKYFVKN